MNTVYVRIQFEQIDEFAVYETHVDNRTII